MNDSNQNTYLRIVDSLGQAIVDIDSITHLLIELVTDNGADRCCLDELGLPESEPLLKTAVIKKVLGDEEEEEGDY